MLRRPVLLLVVIVSLFASTALPATAQDPGSPYSPTSQTEEPAAGSGVLFVENIGQFPSPARFQVRGEGRTIWLAEDGLWITALERSQGANLKLSFTGANPHPRLEPFNPLETQVSYFTGNDPAGWHTAAPAWGGVRYVDLYPGADLEVTGQGGRVVQRLVCRANCSFLPEAIRLRIEGAEEVTLDGQDLLLQTAAGAFSLPLLTLAAGSGAVSTAAPSLYPAADALAFEVSSPFAGTANAANPPSGEERLPSDFLLYATFLGGDDFDEGQAVATDSTGRAYTTGQTWSTDFPSQAGAFATSFSGGFTDAFVARLNRTGSQLSYVTFLGGSQDEWIRGIALDKSGAAYLALETQSADFPATEGAYAGQYRGSSDVAVVKLSPDGSSLVYATFLGGNQADGGRSIVVDAAGQAYITGYTYSPDFPTTAGAYQRSYNGYSDVFVARLDAAGTNLGYSTFLGSPADEGAEAIAVDAQGAVYLTGWTNAQDFPTTPGAVSPAFNGGYFDAFLTKLDPTGSGLAYSTLLGGSQDEWIFGVTVNAAGEAYLAGHTYSPDFPTTPDAYDRTCGSDSHCNYSALGDYFTSDLFVARLDAAGGKLLYSTFLGGSDSDYAAGISVDADGTAYVTGSTWSPDFPTTPGSFDQTFNGQIDAFVARLNPAGSKLSYSTYLGGRYDDSAAAIALDPNGMLSLTGHTWSPDFPTTPWAYDQTHRGLREAFVLKLWVQPASEESSGETQADQPSFNAYLPVAVKH